MLWTHRDRGTGEPVWLHRTIGDELYLADRQFRDLVDAARLMIDGLQQQRRSRYMRGFRGYDRAARRTKRRLTFAVDPVAEAARRELGAERVTVGLLDLIAIVRRRRLPGLQLWHRALFGQPDYTRGTRLP
jgi:hypothetical protein